MLKTSALILLAVSLLGCDTAYAEYQVNLGAMQQARIAPHFTAKEFACHHCGIRKVSGKLLYKLELLRAKLLNSPIIITSGYRCSHHNKSIGGAKHSQHQCGKAADIQVKGYTPEEVAKAAKSVGFSFIKVYPHHTHVDVR